MRLQSQIVYLKVEPIPFFVEFYLLWHVVVCVVICAKTKMSTHIERKEPSYKMESLSKNEINTKKG